MDVAGLLQFSQTYLEVFVGVVSALIAMISALIARGETRRQRNLQTANLRQAIDAASLDWGNAAIDTMARCAMFARTRQMQTNEGGFLANKANLLVALSTLVDRGRLFFPNLNPDRKGAEKEGAYRGHRPPILDALMWTYHELEALTREVAPPPTTAPPSSTNAAGFWCPSYRPTWIRAARTRLLSAMTIRKMMTAPTPLRNRGHCARNSKPAGPISSLTMMPHNP